MVRLAIFILRHILSVGQLKISLPGHPDIVVTPRRQYQRAEKPLPDRPVAIAIALLAPLACWPLCYDQARYLANIICAAI